MKIIITEDKLDKIYEGFKRVMEEYSNLHKKKIFIINSGIILNFQLSVVLF